MDKDNKKIVKNNKRQGNERINIESFRKRVENIIGTEHGSQAKAAEKLNVSGQLLSDILAGRRPVTVDFLIDFSNVYGCSIDYLLGNDHTTNEKSQTEESPTLQKILSIIDNLCVHNHISVEHIERNEITELNGVSGYPEYEDITLPVIIPESKSLRKSLEEYTQLINCDLANPVLKRTILTQWIDSQFEMNLEDLKEVEDLPFL